MTLVMQEVASIRKRTLKRKASRPHTSSIPEGFDCPSHDRPVAGEVPMSADLRDLPPDLQHAVRFYHIDGFSLLECGLLLGCTAETVRTRLHRAAELLAPDGAEQPTSAKHERVRKRA